MAFTQKPRRIPPATLERAKELRREMTPQERKLWARLRGRQFYNLKFRRQHPMHPYILDFYCHQQSLAIEIDGHGHGEAGQESHDQARTEWLARRGVRVIRFTNVEVNNNIDGVLIEIARACGIEE